MPFHVDMKFLSWMMSQCLLRLRWNPCLEWCHNAFLGCHDTLPLEWCHNAILGCHDTLPLEWCHNALLGCHYTTLLNTITLVHHDHMIRIDQLTVVYRSFHDFTVCMMCIMFYIDHSHFYNTISIIISTRCSKQQVFLNLAKESNLWTHLSINIWLLYIVDMLAWNMKQYICDAYVVCVLFVQSCTVY